MKTQLLTLVFFLLFSSVAFSQDQSLHVSNSISVDSVIANEFVDNYNTDFELLNKKQNRQANQTTSTGTYTYYPDGSLKSDSQRGITLILYDSFLSKMKEIQFSNGKIMRFYYNALGELLKRTFGSDTWAYSGNMVYKNGQFYQINFPGGRMVNKNGTWEKQFYHEDHLGSNRVVYAANGNKLEVVEQTDYDPFGMELAHSTSGNPKEIYHFQGKEKIDELGWTNFGARMYDPQIGRFLSVDPMAGHPQQYRFSPYAPFWNNPLKYIDPDGRIPYPITIRAFAPFNEFGFGFHGDGRGYSTSSSATARLHQIIYFDTDKTNISTRAWSSPSYISGYPEGAITAIPKVEFTKGLSINEIGNSKLYEFETSLEASNPKIPIFSPNINVFSDISVIENKKSGTITISGKITGDNFPSTEAFVTDPGGNSLFLGVGQIGSSVNRNTGPISELPGEHRRNPITNFKLTISIDGKGNFKGVQNGGRSISISDWNKKFSNTPPQRLK